ncbi:META domain-containing protein [Flavobacterium sp. 9]|uniref:META domain-containing protein n=1 Tax=Flavobacterium sp. 9 TaxID=2035198 RepID=UPI000C195113|nr:META domain-containing protein [Flavobacterium sp. 9]PIF30086.1 META domain-containing protein [Flavobacterium sp. 9]
MKHKCILIALLFLSTVSYGIEKVKIENSNISAAQYNLKNILKSSVSADGIYDTKMILTRLNGKAVSSTGFFITIDSGNNTIQGKSGCNNFSVNYKNLAKKNHIETSSPIGTMMACDEEKMGLEQEFISVMDNKILKITRKKNTVIFKDLRSKTIMEFMVPTQNGAWSFIGKTNWKLIQLEGVGRDYGPVSIKFDPVSSKVSGKSGCNSFFGTYTTDGDFIVFSKIGTTRMACLDEQTGITEQKILGFLNQKLRFDLADQTLNFYLDDKLVMMFAI